MPGESWKSLNEFGDYCLLKNRALVGRKEVKFTKEVKDGAV
jgi:alpha-1,2-mannosyltransferase